MGKKIKFIQGQMIEYEIYKLVDFYDPVLRHPTQEVDFQNPQFQILYTAMSLMETLGELNGLGLSANQVGLPYRMFAMNMGDKIWSFINPKIISKSDATSKYKEGCLSFPGLYLELNRAETITVEFQAIGGEVMTQEFSGLTATCIQHEIDHLDGVMFTDLVSPIKLDMAKRKIKTNIKKMKRMGRA